MKELQKFLTESTAVGLFSWSVQCEAMERFSLSSTVVEKVALETGLLPARYQRNREMISAAQQLQLFNSRVVVVGCGGLGGYIIEELARLGVGHIVAIDPDRFEEHNLNRQLFSDIDRLGQAKVEAVAERVALINPSVTVVPCQVAFSRQNGATLWDRADVVADALDSIPVRLELAELCREREQPMVHGAIAGWYGHVATIMPGDDVLETIYRHWQAGKGIEQHLGTPSFTPALVASLQVAEICKILLDQGVLLRRRMLSINLLDMVVEEITL